MRIKYILNDLMKQVNEKYFLIYQLKIYKLVQTEIMLYIQIKMIDEKYIKNELMRLVTEMQ